MIFSNNFRLLTSWYRNLVVILPRRIISSTQPKQFLEDSPNAVLNKCLLNRYQRLPIPKNLTQATYLWIDGTGEHVRSKDRIFLNPPESIDDIPVWTYDGSSTYQAEGGHSDTYLKPQAIYRNPFKASENDILIMCDTYHPDGCPTNSNNRHKMEEAYEATKQHEPWFGIEQEYTFLNINGRPYGWPVNGYPAPQGPYYCSVGANYAYGRDMVESHVLACLYAGITLCGTNAEVLPSQWEFQVGPVEGVKIGDDIWVARYILQRIAEQYGIDVTFDPKPVEGAWNGSGAHTNFSTKEMRADGGLKTIKAAIAKLEKRHNQHIAVYDPKYGKDNMRRLSGALETSNIEKFSWGTGDRNVSVRIPDMVAKNGKGFLEDRRPAANCDPYSVCTALLQTCLIDTNSNNI